jgi:hypothetical protein
VTDHDFGPAVARLIDGGSPPPESWGGPPRPLPPRPVPRHLRAAAPTPRQRAATARADQRATTRRRRVLDALARIGGAA